ncbi:hypothetical protein SAMN02745164_01889 [Marinitoga hydrogenitolerans DSM 16785]|uniref:DUF3352 domain-containing protein n=1 Tax=Marinitoga hydrogenitolerans (strain DSM 16785 / JCM 12826 / AT1271) TaxID=1122195 RepID=A0A1M4ZCB6_MARH1|nr:hypothetical protein [Marinitoga hydrogenitolerans]SHF15256.1 hypothetical protein SAMN02745164_01889 [Marinitoga hydrogenitolerans DSM 16785]
MKKFIFILVIFIFSLDIFANIYDVIPQNSKAVIVLNNAKTVYSDLKTVPLFGKILDDPTYAETLITGMIDAYIQSLEMESDEVYAGFENNIGFFIIEPKDNEYDFGIVLGPLNNGNRYIEILSKVINALMPENNSNITFSYLIKKSDLQDYLIITTNKVAYESSKLKFIPKKRYNDTGIYEEINTSSIKGYGFSNVKDGYLYSKFNLLTDSEIAPGNINIEKSKFFGLYFSKTTYLPKNVSFDLNSFGMNIPDKLFSAILEKAEWAEQSGTINLKTNEETGDIISEDVIKVMIKTSITIKEIEVLIPEDTKTEKLGNDYIKITKTLESTVVSLFLWKDNDILYISNVDKNELNKYEKQATILSENKLYNELKEKIPNANVGTLFFDLKPLVNFLKDYLGVEGLDGEFGGLGNAIATKTPDGKNVIEFNFVMK